MRRRVMREAAPSCLQVRWLDLYLLLLFAACTPVPAFSSVTPTAGSTMREHCLTKIFLCQPPFAFLPQASGDAATRAQACQ